jgi:GNAT superfamily N-acetyltransferase
MSSPPDPLRNLLKASAMNSIDEHWIDFDGRARRAWFTLDDQQLKEASPLTHPETLVRPVMLIVENNIASATLEQARQLHRAMRSHGLAVELLEHARAETEDPVIAPEAVYTGIQEFFNLHLYNFTVKVGTPTVKGEP